MSYQEKKAALQEAIQHHRGELSRQLIRNTRIFGLGGKRLFLLGGTALFTVWVGKRIAGRSKKSTQNTLREIDFRRANFQDVPQAVPQPSDRKKVQPVYYVNPAPLRRKNTLFRFFRREITFALIRVARKTLISLLRGQFKSEAK